MANLTVKEARKLYFKAFPKESFHHVEATPTPAGHVLIISHNDQQVDQVLVRYDRTIFRNYEQVYPEVGNE